MSVETWTVDPSKVEKIMGAYMQVRNKAIFQTLVLDVVALGIVLGEVVIDSGKDTIGLTAAAALILNVGLGCFIAYNHSKVVAAKDILDSAANTSQTKS